MSDYNEKELRAIP